MSRVTSSTKVSPRFLVAVLNPLPAGIGVGVHKMYRHRISLIRRPFEKYLAFVFVCKTTVKDDRRSRGNYLLGGVAHLTATPLHPFIKPFEIRRGFALHEKQAVVPFIYRKPDRFYIPTQLFGIGGFSSTRQATYKMHIVFHAKYRLSWSVDQPRMNHGRFDSGFRKIA